MTHWRNSEHRLLVCEPSGFATRCLHSSRAESTTAENISAGRTGRMPMFRTIRCSFCHVERSETSLAVVLLAESGNDPRFFAAFRMTG